jgi:hypothetical protein
MFIFILQLKVVLGDESGGILDLGHGQYFWKKINILVALYALMTLKNRSEKLKIKHGINFAINFSV